uniref:Uncharacterized protein n=1 Tax=Rhizophora mucronata TaxID=61149 RepID=A0A2P2JN51_RHIMU
MVFKIFNSPVPSFRTNSLHSPLSLGPFSSKNDTAGLYVSCNAPEVIQSYRVHARRLYKGRGGVCPVEVVGECETESFGIGIGGSWLRSLEQKSDERPRSKPRVLVTWEWRTNLTNSSIQSFSFTAFVPGEDGFAFSSSILSPTGKQGKRSKSIEAVLSCTSAFSFVG